MRRASARNRAFQGIKIDLAEEAKMATYVELKEKAEDLMRQAEAARKAEIGAAIAEIKAKMAAYGITLDDLGGKAKTRRGRKPKAVQLLFCKSSQANPLG